MMLWILSAKPVMDPVVCVVTRVVDGDTVKVDCLPQSLRLCSIDAPEKKQPFGSVRASGDLSQSTEYLKSLVLNKRVEVIPVQMDPYGRVVEEMKIGGWDVSALDGASWIGLSL